MTNAMKITTLVSLLTSAQVSFAGFTTPPVQGLPLELSGIAGVTALSLIIAAQLIKRRK